MTFLVVLLQFLITAISLAAGYYFFPAELELVVIFSLLLFITLSYMNYRLKRKFPWFYLLLSTVIFAYFYVFDNYNNLIYHATVALSIFLVLMMHANWKSTRIFLGKQYSLSKLQKENEARHERISKIKLDEVQLIRLVQEYSTLSREQLIEDEYLKNPPPIGKGIIKKKYRTPQGERLLMKAKDLLYALLYGDKSLNVKLLRTEDKLLTLSIPRLKAYPLQPVLKDAAISSGRSKLLDPNQKGEPILSDVIVLEVQYREIPSEVVGDGIKACLLLINNLEINETLFNFYMTKVTQSNFA